MSAPLYDAHLHLQDARLDQLLPTLFEGYAKAGVARVVVNGTSPEDWPAVRALAQAQPLVLPSFGLHPWRVDDAPEDWRETLLHTLDAGGAVGEIGLDRWIEHQDFEAQREAFHFQLCVAAERNLPCSIHCLKAWGPLLEILEAGPRPARGFLVHGYGGSSETAKRLLALGARFSLNTYFAHPRKERQRETLRQIPITHLLLETDAPDMAGPSDYCEHSLEQSEHPLNIVGAYQFAAELYALEAETLRTQVAENFQQFFSN